MGGGLWDVLWVWRVCVCVCVREIVGVSCVRRTCVCVRDVVYMEDCVNVCVTEIASACVFARARVCLRMGGCMYMSVCRYHNDNITIYRIVMTTAIYPSEYLTALDMSAKLFIIPLK